MLDRSLNSILDRPLTDFSLPVDFGSSEFPTGLALNALMALFVASLMAFILAEKKRPFLNPGKAALRHSYLTNINSYLANDFILSLCQVPAMYLVAAGFADLGLLSGMEEGWAKSLLALVLLDLTMYGWHALNHHCDALWLLHRVHHSDRSVNVTTGLRYHLGELLLEAMVRATFIVVVGISVETLLICQGLMSVFILMHHSNIRLPAERWLAAVFIVPSLHRTHHSAVRGEHDSNYGAVFSIWDRAFGTLLLREPKSYGIASGACEPFGGWLSPGAFARLSEAVQHAIPHEMASIRIVSRRKLSNRR